MGKALALEMAKAGCRLAINDWNAETLAHTVADARDLGAETLSRDFDVAQRTATYSFAQEVVDHYGQVDIVINNAGIAHEQLPIEQIGYDQFEKVINVNLWGVINGSKAFLPYLKERPEAALVNLSSVFGLVAYPLQGPYVTTKFAVRGFTEMLRVELAGTPVSVTCVHPAVVRTNIVRNMDTPNTEERDELARKFEKLASVSSEQAARKIIRGIRRQQRRVLIGREAYIVDWLARILPHRYEKIILRQYNLEKID